MIPSRTVVTPKHGDNSIVVWSLQRALDQLVGISLGTDGVFGDHTATAVMTFQKSAKITQDGKPGPVTQKALIAKHIEIVEKDYAIPQNMLTGFAAAEGGWLLGAVNWSVPGGVDCGCFQRRVYVEDYSNVGVVQRAFDVRYQARLLAGNLASLRGIFVARAGTCDGTLPVREKAWRLAALNHNYPAGADRLSRTPITALTSYWRSAQPWVVAVGAKFPDGSPVRTPLEWTHLYAGLFAPSHGWNGSVTRYVTSWSALTGVTWSTGLE